MRRGESLSHIGERQMFVCLQMFVGPLSECLSTDLINFIGIRGGGRERGGQRDFYINCFIIDE